MPYCNKRNKIKGVYSGLIKVFAKRQEKLAFSEFAGKTNEEKIATFVPLLHLDSQHKVWLEQDKHFEEIWILLKHLYEKQNAETLEAMKKEAGIAIRQLVKEEKANKTNKDKKKEADDEVGDALTGLTGFSNKKVDEIRELKEVDDEQD